jgi:hypothetical protein
MRKTTSTKKPRRDTRTPTSVTHIGKFTVYVYDEEAYKRMKEQYCSEGPDERETPTPVHKTSYEHIKEEVSYV